MAPRGARRATEVTEETPEETPSEVTDETNEEAAPEVEASPEDVSVEEQPEAVVEVAPVQGERMYRVTPRQDGRGIIAGVQYAWYKGKPITVNANVREVLLERNII